MKSQKPLSRKDNIVVQELEGEVLVYDLGENKAFCLNETSAIVWEACDGNRTIPEISDFVSKKLNSSTSEDLIWLALDQLKKEKLLSNPQDLEINFNGLSRREAIRKVGFASLAALPVIMAISAPNAYASASACAAGGVVVGSQCLAADPGCTIAEIGLAAPDQSAFDDGCNLMGATPGCSCRPTYSGGNYICSGVGVRAGTCG